MKHLLIILFFLTSIYAQDHNHEPTKPKVEEKIDLQAIIKSLSSEDAKERKASFTKSTELTFEDRYKLIQLLEKSKDPELKLITEKLKKLGLVTTASGLKYTILRKGKEKQPKALATVTLHYKGTLINGDIFHSSYGRGRPIKIPLNSLIKGWREGLLLMKEGAKYKFTIPANLAYRNSEMGDIPANSTLIIIVELIKVH